MKLIGVLDQYRGLLRSFGRHLQEVNAGGFPVFLRKGKMVLLTLIAVPILVVVYALRPVILIRFGPILCQRIGNLAAFTEM